MSQSNKTKGKCLKCVKIGKFVCSRCKTGSYCSQECQKLDWKLHKKNCKAISSATLQTKPDVEVVQADNPILGKIMKSNRSFKKGEVILREEPLISYRKEGKEETVNILGLFEHLKYSLVAYNNLSQSNKKRFLKLHYPKDRLNIMLLQSGIRNLFKTFAQKKKLMMNFEEAIKVLAICNCNQFSKGGDSKLCFVQDKCSRINHSCLPNCMFMREKNNKLSVRALRNIYEGEELNITYLNETKIMESTSLRRTLLHDQYAFECMCKRCTKIDDKMRKFLCPNCQKGHCYLNRDVPKCQFCSETLRAHKEVKLVEKYAMKKIHDIDTCPNSIVIPLYRTDPFLLPQKASLMFKKEVLSVFGKLRKSFKNHSSYFVAIDVIRDMFKQSSPKNYKERVGLIEIIISFLDRNIEKEIADRKKYLMFEEILKIYKKSKVRSSRFPLAHVKKEMTRIQKVYPKFFWDK